MRRMFLILWQLLLLPLLYSELVPQGTMLSEPSLRGFRVYPPSARLRAYQSGKITLPDLSDILLVIKTDLEEKV